MGTILKVLIFILVFTTNVLANCIKGNCENGQGTFAWSDGKKYVGEFKEGKRNGQGTFTWPSGTKYVGEFKNGKMHGNGILTSPDGKKYIGEFKDNKFNKQKISISLNAKTKKIGNGLTIDIPDGYQYDSITLEKLLSRFKNEIKDLSEEDLKEAEDFGIGKSAKLIIISKNKKIFDLFNMATTPSGFEEYDKKYLSKFDEIYNDPNYWKIVVEAIKKQNPNLDINKISKEEWTKLVEEIFNDKDFDKKYKKLNKMIVEHSSSVVNEMIYEHAIDEPKIIIFLGDKKMKDEDLDEINDLYPDLAYVRLIKFVKTIPGLEKFKFDERKIQIQRNKFGNLYMIDNIKNINVDTFFSKPQFSELVWTTHKNKWFLAISNCWNKCNNSSTGTDLGLIDILGRTELFESIHQSTVNIRY